MTDNQTRSHRLPGGDLVIDLGSETVDGEEWQVLRHGDHRDTVKRLNFEVRMGRRPRWRAIRRGPAGGSGEGAGV